MPGDGLCGIGVIIRDWEGNSMASATWKIQCLEDPSVTEAIVIKLGMKFALEMLHLQLIIESNALSLVSTLQDETQPSSYVGLILDDRKLLEAQFLCVSYAHVCREGNKVAHTLVKYALDHCDQYWIEEVPPIVTNVSVILNKIYLFR